MKTAVVTGATSQAGISMSNFLSSHGVRVVAAVRNPDNHLIKHVNHDVLQVFDLNDSYSINGIISGEKPDYFINCAATSFVGSSNQFPFLHFQSNVQAIIYQLEAIKNIVPECRYINYGSAEQLAGADFSPQKETNTPSPINFYGVSKVCSHEYIKAYRDIYGLFTVQNYSYNFESKFRSDSFILKKITNWAKKITDKTNITPLFVGNIKACRDFSHVDDVTEAYWLSLNNKKPVDYIVASGKPTSISYFILRVLEFVGFNRAELFFKNQDKTPEEGEDIPVLYYKDKPIVYSTKKFYRENDPVNLVGDSSKIKKELGWEPKKGMDDIIKDFLE